MIKRCLIALLAAGMIGCAETYEKVEIKHENADVTISYFLCRRGDLFAHDWEPPIMYWNVSQYPWVTNRLVFTYEKSPVLKNCVPGLYDVKRDLENNDPDRNIIEFENVSSNYNLLLAIPTLPVDEIAKDKRFAEVSIYKIERFNTSMNTDDFKAIIKDVREEGRW